jgi:hypothetical protein
MAPETTLSLVVSASALIVSLVALYAQFFRRRVRLNAVLVEKSWGSGPAQAALLTARHDVTGALQVLGREGAYWAVFAFRR